MVGAASIAWWLFSAVPDLYYMHCKNKTDALVIDEGFSSGTGRRSHYVETPYYDLQINANKSIRVNAGNMSGLEKTDYRFSHKLGDVITVHYNENSASESLMIAGWYVDGYIDGVGALSLFDSISLIFISLSVFFFALGLYLLKKSFLPTSESS